LLPALLLGEAFRTQWFSTVPPSRLSSPTCSLAAYQDKWPFHGIGHLPHQKISRLSHVGDVPLIIQRLLFKIFWELLAYRRPTPQRQPHPAHEPYGQSFTGFKTTSRNVQKSGLFYRLLAKKILTHKQSSRAFLTKELEDCVINFRK